MRFHTSLRKLLGPLAALLACSLPAQALAGQSQSPAQQAVAELRQPRHVRDIVQNRFFLKKHRFELAPVLGYVPNNPFARRYVGGVLLGYHLSEEFSAEGAILYSPDLGMSDLKGLTSTLVTIAAADSSSHKKFQQPVEKMTLGATFAGRWAPFYGKINLLGEKVLNFDLYGAAGLGLLSIREYYATYNSDAAEGESVVNLEAHENKVTVPANLGVGFDFFLNQTIAVKLDARTYLYVDDKPDYDPDDTSPVGKRLYNTFIASAGVSIFLPKMKPRMTNF